MNYLSPTNIRDSQRSKTKLKNLKLVVNRSLEVCCAMRDIIEIRMSKIKVSLMKKKMTPVKVMKKKGRVCVRVLLDQVLKL